MNASGTFDASLVPQTFHSEGTDGAKLNRMTIDKTFTGDINGISTGEILSVMTTTPGSAGYIAIE